MTKWPMNGNQHTNESRDLARSSREGGLLPRYAAGHFTQSWWAGRWIRAITQWVSPTRLARGRSYARRGQVLDLEVQVGLALARVQGSQPTPYRVRIEMRTLTDAEWRRATQALAGRAIYAAQLLNGEMPYDIESVFQGASVPLFPASRDDLTMQCTCPDLTKPCKHVAAVCYVLGAHLDEDPFSLLTLRGRTKEQIMAELRERHAELVGPGASNSPMTLTQRADASLEECLDTFWEAGPEIKGMPVRVVPAEVEMEAIRMLGDPTFIEDEALSQRLAEVYRLVSRRALDVAFGEH